MQSAQHIQPTEMSSLALLQTLYPGAVLLDTDQVAAAVGLNPKTIRNLRDKFPVPSLKFGHARRYRLVDVAAVIDAGLPLRPVGEPSKAKRGRPPKLERREGGAA